MNDNTSKDALTRTLHIGNVSRSVSKSTLWSVLEPFGCIEKLRVSGTAERRTRYWFVQFASDQAAKDACRLNGRKLAGHKLRVSFAKTKRATRWNKKHQVEDKTKQCIEPVTCKDDPKDLDSVTRTNEDKIQRTVFVLGIETQYCALDIAKFFSYCGTVLAVRRSSGNGGSNPKTWVEFASILQAQRAISCNGQFFDALPLVIEPSKTEICTNELPQAVGYVHETGFFPLINKRLLIG